MALPWDYEKQPQYDEEEIEPEDQAETSAPQPIENDPQN